QSTRADIFGIALEHFFRVREPVRAAGERRSVHRDFRDGDQANQHTARGSAIRRIFLPASDEFLLLRLALPASSPTHLISGVRPGSFVSDDNFWEDSMSRSIGVRSFLFSWLLLAIVPIALWAAIFGTVRGVVHDPDHRPVPDAQVLVKSAGSDYSQKLATNPDGAFEATTLPVGAYTVTVMRDGFATSVQQVVVASGSAPVLHFQLALGTRQEQVSVSESALTVNPEQMTPTTIISRSEIAATPGADLSNSLRVITDYVPGAWVTHDQLHVRGGHQVSWAIDGVPIPNTNIASNVGPQIDPKDIDYLEAQRGGYSSAYGDRTYGVFNVVPRT